MVFGPSRFKACVAPGCIESADDNEGWQVAGISATGRVEYWCSTCASSLMAKHLTLDRARVERLAALSRLPHEIIEQSTATDNPAQVIKKDPSHRDVPSRARNTPILTFLYDKGHMTDVYRCNKQRTSQAILLCCLPCHMRTCINYS